MENKWCWRCQITIPMLNQEEFKQCIEAREKGKSFVKAEIQKRNIQAFEWLGDKLYGGEKQRYFIEMYRVITGFYTENNPNAIWHHLISLYGADCLQCSKPLRTKEARYCASCGFGKENLTLYDGLKFEDDVEGIIFNHYSFCEIIKHIASKYSNVSYQIAHKKLHQSFLVQKPTSKDEIALLGHELEYHWAMLIVHGDMYWTKGIASDFNEFREEYLTWESNIKSVYNLKDAFDYYDL